MKKAPLYSRSRRGVAATDAPPPEPVGAPQEAPAAPSRLRVFAGRHERALWVAALLVLVLAVMSWRAAPKPPAPLSFEQIDHLVRQSIAEKPLASAGAKAYEKIIPSVVRVVGYDRAGQSGTDPHADRKPRRDTPGSDDARPKRDGGELPGFEERGVGTGVVIVDKGVILTNLHVVQTADTIKVVFADGLETTASITGAQPENDLAVLQAHKIPDDLIPATMRSTHDLQPGDQVVAVGFPFGIGPSYSAGVISGLQRVFRSPEGKQKLSNLIQFDAAANPGNSGGPLVTMDGAVVGIVTAILNPTPARTFLGIAFAVPIENAASAVGLHPF